MDQIVQINESSSNISTIRNVCLISILIIKVSIKNKNYIITHIELRNLYNLRKDSTYIFQIRIRQNRWNEERRH